MQKVRKVRPESAPQDVMIARPPPIEVLAAEGFAQDPSTAPRLSHSPTVSLTEFLLDGSVLPESPQSQGRTFKVRLPDEAISSSATSSSPASAPAALAQFEIQRQSATPQTPQSKAVSTPQSKSTVRPAKVARISSQPSFLECSTVRPRLHRTNTAPAGGCQDSATRASSLPRLPSLSSPSKSPAAEPKVARPVLRLPGVPLRQLGGAGASSSTLDASPMDAAGRPAVANLLYAQSRGLHDAKAKPLPRRLCAVDDQTAIPIDLHTKMMNLGGLARGAFGYGQHKLQFDESTGAAVLRLRA